ncbi:MAG: hypothetical protein MJ240_13860 [Kiritimatiellae bacterium]|nr:hypothetical protein [Kiritimatiellia bacterium]
MRVRGYLMGVALTLVTALFAGTYDDYVLLTAVDNTDSQSFDNNNKGSWKKGGVAETQGPHAGERYYTNGKTLCTTNMTASASNHPIDLVFQGDELALSGRLWVILKRGSTDSERDDWATLTIPSLTGLPGGNFYSAGPSPARVAGTLTVESTVSDANPFMFFNNASAVSRIVVAFDMIGEQDACFVVSNKVSEATRAAFVFTGDAHAYTGTIRAVSPWTGLVLAAPGGFSTPGTLALVEGAPLTVVAGSTATIGTLDCMGSTVTLATDAGVTAPTRLVVTSRIVNHGMPIKIAMPRTFDFSIAEKIPLVTLAAGAQGVLSAADFALVPGYTCTHPQLSRPEDLADLDNLLNLAVETAADGSQTLFVSHRAVVVLKTSEGDPSASAFLSENADHWDPAGAPVPEKEYYVSTYDGSSRAIHMPNQNHVFAGASLTIGARGTFYVKTSKTFHIDPWRMVPREQGSKIVSQLQVWDSPTFTGRLQIPDMGAAHAVQFVGWNGHNMKIQSVLEGGGDLILSCNATASSNPRITFSLTGDNSAYAGKIRLWHADYTKSDYLDDLDTYSAKLVVASGTGLGGPRAEFAADALSLEQHALLQVTNSAVFNEPTRGWQIVDCGRIEIPANKTVAVNQTITYAGEFRKLGAGRLVLGGCARFTQESSEEPVAGVNRLTIAEGSLTPASTTACDGLAIAFAAGTKLVLDASATGDLRQYGLYNVKWSAPFAVEGGMLPVEFALPADFNGNQCHEFGICTVNAAAAEALTPSQFAVAAPSGMRAKVEKVVRAGVNPVVTFRCSLSPRGLSIFIH